ncbi:hypothetical protein COO60DRAFT_1581207 [Scenedesmus sp. NREL 46B-D3]|nr:hypothetical protein COO60DRAFT_1581207 [Scenedesmus sp. NREL 46B-D3]
MPPPLLETWERVGVDLRQVNADDSDSLLFVTRSGDDSSSFDSSSKPSAAEQQQQQPAAPPDIAQAGSSTKLQPKQQQQQQQVDALPPIYAACRWTVGSLTWLLTLLPMLLLTCMGQHMRGYVYQLTDWLCRMLLLQAPYQDKGTLYYRLGRIHHSARNFFGYRDTIKVRMKQSASGKGEHHKPKLLEVKRRNPFSPRFALTALPVKLLFMMLVLALFCTTSASAMQLRTRTAALGYNLLSTTPDPCPVPPPFRTGQVLAWTVTSELGKLRPAAGAQQASTPPTTTSASILDAYTPDGEKEVEDLSSRWETDPEHKWIYGNHPDMAPAQKEQLKQMLLEERGAFAYSLEDLAGYSGDLGPAVLHMKNDKHVWSSDRNFSPLEKQIGREKVAEMLQAGIVEEAATLNARYASAVTMPAKRAPDGSWVRLGVPKSIAAVASSTSRSQKSPRLLRLLTCPSTCLQTGLSLASLPCSTSVTKRATGAWLRLCPAASPRKRKGPHILAGAPPWSQEPG